MRILLEEINPPSVTVTANLDEQIEGVFLIKTKKEAVNVVYKLIKDNFSHLFKKELLGKKAELVSLLVDGKTMIYSDKLANLVIGASLSELFKSTVAPEAAFITENGPDRAIGLFVDDTEFKLTSVSKPVKVTFPDLVNEFRLFVLLNEKLYNEILKGKLLLEEMIRKYLREEGVSETVIEQTVKQLKDLQKRKEDYKVSVNGIDKVIKEIDNEMIELTRDIIVNGSYVRRSFDLFNMEQLSKLHDQRIKELNEVREKVEKIDNQMRVVEDKKESVSQSIIRRRTEANYVYEQVRDIVRTWKNTTETLLSQFDNKNTEVVVIKKRKYSSVIISFSVLLFFFLALLITKSRLMFVGFIVSLFIAAVVVID
ncbi:MAG: hypothetical protein KatS3mg101_0874 [Patescibacteria group bacterium]|nr:MAG: hypothetical protein KatS3mg101_0874 [Patescibacteria group bacterium]